MRSIAPKAATFVAAAINAVTAVGEPWYTSGVHEWNGTAPTLKRRPTLTNEIPMRRKTSFAVPPVIAEAIPAKVIESEYPYR